MTKNKQKIVVGAKAFGFGPVSKLISIISLFDSYDKIFIGDGVALEFTNKHKKLFLKIINREKTKKEIEEIVSDCDFLIIVMDHDLAMMAHQLKKRYYFLDSLFGFWYSNKSDKRLYDNFQRIKKNKEVLNIEDWRSLSVHEKKLFSHFLSEKSFVQNFFGVRSRVEEFRKLGLDKIIIVTPIVPDQISKKFVIKKNGTLLINLGGVQNFIVKDNNCSYVNLIEKLSIDLISEVKYLSKIIICSGVYKKNKSIMVGDKTIKHVFWGKDEFIKKMNNSQFYMSSPGITSFYEQLYFFRPTIYLPEQHSSQHYNINHFKKTFFKKYCISLFDIIGLKDISRDDFKGSCQVINFIDVVLKKNRYYLNFKESVIRALDLIKEEELGKYKKKSKALINQLNEDVDCDFKNLKTIILKNEKRYGTKINN